MRLNWRPNGVSCGPKPPMWQDVQGWCVWRAKDGTAHTFGANAVNTSRANMKENAFAPGACNPLQRTTWLDSMTHPLVAGPDSTAPPGNRLKAPLRQTSPG